MAELSSIQPSQAPQTLSPDPRSGLMVSSSNLPTNAIVLYDTRALTGPPSLNELLTSDSVVLNIGAEKTRTTVHRNLFRGISEPLDQLLNSHSYGHVSNVNESLRFDDTEAFFELVRIAYKIASTDKDVLNSKLAATQPTSSPNTPPVVGPVPNDASAVIPPLKCKTCKKEQVSLIVACVNTECSATNIEYGMKAFCETRFKLQRGAAKASTSMHQQLDFALDTKGPDGKHLSLVHFAKVYTLAQKYQVPTLKVSALRAFEKRLSRYAKEEAGKDAKHGAEENDNDELYDVLRYLASLATHGTESPLCRSLFRYLIGALDTYLDHYEFKEIMAANGILGLELAQVVRETMTASAAQGKVEL